MSQWEASGGALADIRKQIMWNRLIAVVEEQAMTLLRTAFSPIVRECGDLSAGVFDRRGRMLAQAVTGTPGHVNSMANGVAHFLKKFPIDEMKPGDHFITNDPWLASGHLHDITVVTPTFVSDKPIALFACTIHVVDIGGRGFGPDGRQVYEEGIFIPIMRLTREGRMNEDLLDMVRHNVREPDQVLGDIFSCAASNEQGASCLVAMMREYRIDDIEAVETDKLHHTAGDVIERIHFPYHARVVRADIALLENLASAHSPPSIAKVEGRTVTLSPSEWKGAYAIDMVFGYIIAIRRGATDVESFLEVNAYDLNVVIPGQGHATVSVAAVDFNGRISLFSPEVPVD